ncbi:MAG: cell division protein ZapA [Chloroherpetonaceae bacterium]
MQSLKVRILSEEYAFRTENPELTRAAVEEVNRLVGEYRQKIADYSPVRLAVLAATTLAEKVLEHQQRLNAIQEELERLNHYITTTIEGSHSESRKQDEQYQLAESEADLASTIRSAQQAATADSTTQVQ